MSRLPIRARLTAVFVAVMGGVLVVIGLFLYYRTEHNIDAAINQALRARQGSVQAYARTVDAKGTQAIPPGERFAQLLGVEGRVLDSRPERGRPLLTPAETRDAATRLVTIERHERRRLLAGPTRLHGRRVVAVAATSLADRERALEGLGGALLVGLPLALLLAAGVAYAVAAAALAPVESIRRRAASISRAAPSSGVPVPVADDEIRRLALTLNEMLDRLTAAAEQERSFVANASHELRTPLAALNAELELALRGGRTVDELRTAIVAAKGDGDRLAALAAGLLDLERADTPRERSLERIDVDELLSSAVDDLEHAASTDRTVTVIPSGLAFAGDAAAVTRAVRNLIDNALIHGQGAIRIGAELLPEGRSVRLWVSDQGRLDDELVNGHAFERFTRGPGAVDRRGAGLGLALVRAVAESHGGTASLEARPDGVRAAITIPVA